METYEAWARSRPVLKEHIWVKNARCSFAIVFMWEQDQQRSKLSCHHCWSIMLALSFGHCFISSVKLGGSWRMKEGMGKEQIKQTKGGWGIFQSLCKSEELEESEIDDPENGETLYRVRKRRCRCSLMNIYIKPVKQRNFGIFEYADEWWERKRWDITF